MSKQTIMGNNTCYYTKSSGDLKVCQMIVIKMRIEDFLYVADVTKETI